MPFATLQEDFDYYKCNFTYNFPDSLCINNPAAIQHLLLNPSPSHETVPFFEAARDTAVR